MSIKFMVLMCIKLNGEPAQNIGGILLERMIKKRKSTCTSWVKKDFFIYINPCSFGNK